MENTSTDYGLLSFQQSSIPADKKDFLLLSHVAYTIKNRALMLQQQADLSSNRDAISHAAAGIEVPTSRFILGQSRFFLRVMSKSENRITKVAEIHIQQTSSLTVSSSPYAQLVKIIGSHCSTLHKKILLENSSTITSIRYYF